MAAMEDVLDLYSEDYDPRYPTVCLVDILPTPEGGGFPPSREGVPAAQTGAPLGRVPWRAYPDSTG
ncbi:MAG TPA: hypothetical protein VGS80_14185, partial [Ktedonobacterales bacterium]|nr:hypothetical protein [Ktedonobacterales bacterium]